MFRSELVVLGRECREDGVSYPWSLCSRAFNLEASAWRKLKCEWGRDYTRDEVMVCCATDTVIVTFSELPGGYRLLRSLRPGCNEGWVQIPDPPVRVFSFQQYPPSL